MKDKELKKMAIRWDFKKDRIGTAITTEDTELTLYTGNAFIIALTETETTYNLQWFFADEQHAKNCLGLNKEYKGCWKSFGIKKLILDVNFKETPKLISILCKAKAEIEIELYNPPF